MREVLDAVSLVAEVLTWVTLPVGLVVLALGYVRTSMAPEWRHSPAVVLDVPSDEVPADRAGPDEDPGDSHASQEGRALDEWELIEVSGVDARQEPSTVRVLRWFAGDGSVRQTVLDPQLSTDLDPEDELVVYFDPARPELARLNHPPRTARHLVQMGWLLTLIGVACFGITFAMLLAS